MNTNISLTSGINCYQSEKFPAHHSRVKTKQAHVPFTVEKYERCGLRGNKANSSLGNSFIPCMYHIAL